MIKIYMESIVLYLGGGGAGGEGGVAGDSIFRNERKELLTFSILQMHLLWVTMLVIGNVSLHTSSHEQSFSTPFIDTYTTIWGRKYTN